MAAIVVSPSSVAVADAVPALADEHLDAAEELAGQLRRLQPEQVPDLRARDQDADAVGEADDDRPRDVLDRRAESGDAEQDQDHAGHQRAHEQPVEAVGRDDAGHDDDERAGRSADLDARAAERGDREAGDDRAVDAVLRRHARRDRERHRQRQRDEADGDAGEQVARQRAGGIALAQALDELGRGECMRATAERSAGSSAVHRYYIF